VLCWITILGGALLMMGQHSHSEALFYYFRLEDQVPETHLLRLKRTITILQRRVNRHRSGRSRGESLRGMDV
jgi:hypothetical protein